MLVTIGTGSVFDSFVWENFRTLDIQKSSSHIVAKDRCLEPFFKPPRFLGERFPGGFKVSLQEFGCRMGDPTPRGSYSNFQSNPKPNISSVRLGSRFWFCSRSSGRSTFKCCFECVKTLKIFLFLLFLKKKGVEQQQGNSILKPISSN